MKTIKIIAIVLLMCSICTLVSGCAEDESEYRRTIAQYGTPDGKLVEVAVDSWIANSCGTISIYAEDGRKITVGAQNCIIIKEAPE